jgi:DNA-directed RNA polymerase specialized sigma24 family protein
LATQVSIEVFRFAWDNIQQVRMNSSLIAWLQGVALVNILEKYRAKQEDVRNATPVNKININMKLSEIDVLLSLLTFEERLVIVLYDIKKYTLDEIQGLLPEFSLREVRAYLDQGRLKISNGFRR